MKNCDQYSSLIENIENKLRRISRRKSYGTKASPEKQCIHLTNSDLNKTLSDSIMRTTDEPLLPRYPPGKSGASLRHQHSGSTATKTSEILRSHTSNNLQKMEEKYLSLKYPSLPLNFAATEPSQKDLLRTH